MKRNRWPRILGGAIVLVLVVALATVFYIVWFLPDIGLKEISADPTPERLARGKYLAEHVTVCVDCHSTRDWSRFSGPMVPGTEGKGGEIFDEKMGFPGKYRSPNITPFALKDWTDAEIYRAITSGVSRDGHPLFPIMPYPAYGKLDTEDILSIIAYVRSLPPLDNIVERSEPTFPMNVVLHLMPSEAIPQPVPPRSDSVAYGGYVALAAGCVECHTPAEHGQIVKELAYSGGREFQMPDGRGLVSSNLTPDPETGLGKWSREAFLFRFKNYDSTRYSAPVLKPGELQSIMPWTMYAGMDSTDLSALYAYLHSLPPVVNKLAKTIDKNK